jgi:hypothetical protein
MREVIQRVIETETEAKAIVAAWRAKTERFVTYRLRTRVGGSILG